MSALDPTAPEPASPIAGSPSTARLLDELAANATVAPVTRLVDGWLAKAAPGLPFRRANAVLPAVAAGLDGHQAAATLDAVEAWYRSLGRRVLVQVPSAQPGSEALDDLLARRGYEIEAPVDVLVGAVDPIAEAGSRAGDRLRVTLEEQEPAGAAGPPRSGSHPAPARVVVGMRAGIDETWAAAYGDLHGRDQRWRRRTEGYGRMLGVLGPAVLGSTVAVAGGTEVGVCPDPTSMAVPPGPPGPPFPTAVEAPAASAVDGPAATVGIGFAVLERGWAGIFGMGTSLPWRDRGVGATLLGALAAEAHHQGAARLYLQVEVDNAPAQALYRGLGFSPDHRYHYRAR